MEVYMGLIFPSAIPFAPYGTIFCNGSPLSVGANAAMYAVIGNFFGGDQNTFLVPDLRGRVPVGSTTTMGNGVPAGLSTYTFSKTGGAEYVALEDVNLAAHTHDAQIHANNFTFKLSPITATASGTLSVNATAGTTNIPGGATGFPAIIPDMSSQGLSNFFYAAPDGTNNMAVDVSVNVTTPTAVVTGGTVSALIGVTGSGDPFSIVQPWLALNYVMVTMGIFPVRN